MIKNVMSSYEIVKAVLHNQQPQRMAVDFGDLGISDFIWLDVAGLHKFPEGKDEVEDDWGCLWRKTGVENMGQVVNQPLKNLKKLDGIKKPDFSRSTRYKDFPSMITQAEKQGKYVMANIFMLLFERMHSLYGFKNTLCGLLIEPDELGALADFIIETQLSCVDSIYQRYGNRVHGFNFSEDWGTQNAAFISFNLWMDFFFPRYKRLFDHIHQYGYDVWVHSCGKINELVEGFIKAGVDCVGLQQPRILGIQQFGERYRGRICFRSLADIQQTLPTGDLDKIDGDVQDLMHHWAQKCGGFVLTDYGEGHAIGVKQDIKAYMYRQFSNACAELYGEPLPELVLKE